MTNQKPSKVSSDHDRPDPVQTLWTGLANRFSRRTVRPLRRNQSSTSTTAMPPDGLQRVVNVAQGFRIKLQRADAQRDHLVASVADAVACRSRACAGEARRVSHVRDGPKHALERANQAGRVHARAVKHLPFS